MASLMRIFIPCCVRLHQFVKTANRGNLKWLTETLKDLEESLMGVTRSAFQTIKNTFGKTFYFYQSYRALISNILYRFAYLRFINITICYTKKEDSAFLYGASSRGFLRLISVIENKIEVIDIDSLLKLPVLFQSYSGDTKIEKIVEQYKQKYSIEPNVLYRYNANKVSFIAIEVTKKDVKN